MECVTKTLFGYMQQWEKYETSKLLCFICWLFCCCYRRWRCCCCRPLSSSYLLSKCIFFSVRVACKSETGYWIRVNNEMAKATFHLFANDFSILVVANLLHTHNIFYVHTQIYIYLSCCIVYTHKHIKPNLWFGSFCRYSCIEFRSAIQYAPLIAIFLFPFIQWTRSDPNYFLVDFCPTENNYCIHLDLRLTKYTFSTHTHTKKKMRKMNCICTSFVRFFCHPLPLSQLDSTWTVIDPERLNLSYSFYYIFSASVVVRFFFLISGWLLKEFELDPKMIGMANDSTHTRIHTTTGNVKKGNS